ncbi:MAG TPA: SDR family oxidoreductase [Jatrophihabitans sp.]|nr:SDR family oxidoreductase [Jatrophihabitans sp.]
MTKTAVITGVGRRRGIGAGLAAGLAADGWNLALSFWRPYDERLGLEGAADDLQPFADELSAAGVQVELLPADLSVPTGPGGLIERAAERFDSLDALVMSHGESVDSNVLTTSVESFDRHYAVNVRATWLLIAAFAGQLPAAGGSVVALTSDHTVENLPYGATKAALDRIVLAAAHELGSRGLRANVLNPGPIDTGWMTPELRAQLTERQPTGRLGTPTDIANTVRFLLSDQGQWITGQLIHCNGGFPYGQLPV